MFVKILIILFLVAILYSLGSSFYYLVQDKGKGDRTVRRLTWRVGLSLLLFVLMMAGYKLGLIQPSSNNPVVRPAENTEIAE